MSDFLVNKIQKICNVTYLLPYASFVAGLQNTFKNTKRLSFL